MSMKNLKWMTDPHNKGSMFESYWTEEYFGYRIEIRHIMHLNKHMYVLTGKERLIGYFKKLSSAKKVAQLIYNQ